MQGVAGGTGRPLDPGFVRTAFRGPFFRQAVPTRSARALCLRSVAAGDKGVDTDLDRRILSGKYTKKARSRRELLTKPVRKALAKDGIGPGRLLALWLARLGRTWNKDYLRQMPQASGDIREIVGQPVFLPLQKLAQAYGPVFRLSFGPKSFVIVSDAAVAKQILLTNASRYSKGILSEILYFVMGTGLIPADGEVWRTRRRALVPSLHAKFIQSMLGLFGSSTLHGAAMLEKAAVAGQPVEMENFFSRLTLDIIGKAVFDIDFDSLTHDDPIIQAVYTVLREAEHRSTAFIPYWELPPLRWLVPRQRRCMAALKVINTTLDGLIADCLELVRTEDQEFEEEFVGETNPSMLHFLLASGDEVSSKQLRDDLMTMLIAGHETTAAVLTWTMYCLAQNSQVVLRLQAEVDRVLGDAMPGIEQLKELRYTTRVINEAMRLYPQPPVLIRRALLGDTLSGFPINPNTDIFISVWNLHRSPELWQDPDTFNPDRFPVDQPIPTEVTHNFAYLPFGGGRRKCIGDQFALFEAVTALAVLVRRFEFSMAAAAPPVSMETGATIHISAGLLMDIKLRNGASLASDATAVSQNGLANGVHVPSAATAGAETQRVEVGAL